MPGCFLAAKLKYPYVLWKEASYQDQTESKIKFPKEILENNENFRHLSNHTEFNPSLLFKNKHIFNNNLTEKTIFGANMIEKPIFNNNVDEVNCDANNEEGDVDVEDEKLDEEIDGDFESSPGRRSRDLTGTESSLPTSGTPCGSPHPTESGARTPCKLFRPYCLDDPVDRKPALPGAVGGLPSSLPEYLPHHESWWFPPPLDLSKQDNLPFKPEPEYVNCSGGAPVYKINGGKTTVYTYHAFFASDGRSKKKLYEFDIVKPKYKCNECGKNYATSSNLSRHKQTHKTLDAENAKKCHVCGKAYVSMPALSMHVLTHNLSHKCQVCGKAFSRPWLLQGHMRSHTGDKPYGCAHCGKSFADRSNLRAHMQTHSAFKNYKCKRCNKSFALKSYLNKHYESACYKDQPIPRIDSPPLSSSPTSPHHLSSQESQPTSPQPHGAPLGIPNPSPLPYYPGFTMPPAAAAMLRLGGAQHQTPPLSYS